MCCSLKSTRVLFLSLLRPTLADRRTDAEELGPSWRDLARALNIREAPLSNVDEENKHIKDKCYAVITIWQRALGKEATKGRFVDALLAIRRKDIAEKLGEYYFLFSRIVSASLISFT